MAKHLIQLTKESQRYREIYKRARLSRSRVTSVYDISYRCNLFCEGCLFFNKDGGFSGDPSEIKEASYENLFSFESRRGVTYPLLAGAEPSLEQSVLHEAAKYWKTGMVHTNGIKPIDPGLPFRLYISLWGGPELTKKWRGADCYNRVLDYAASDQRAIINYTINSENINDIYRVASDCNSRGLTLTFQMYSPTDNYLNYINDQKPGKYKYIQGDSSLDNLILTKDDDKRAELAVIEVIEKFPKTIVFTKKLANWIFSRHISFTEFASGSAIPTKCPVGNDSRHQHHLLGGEKDETKTCGHPSIDCRTCRLYTTIYPVFLSEKLASSMSREDSIDFLDAHHVFDVIFEGHRGVKWEPKECDLIE